MNFVLFLSLISLSSAGIITLNTGCSDITTVIAAGATVKAGFYFATANVYCPTDPITGACLTDGTLLDVSVTGYFTVPVTCTSGGSAFNNLIINVQANAALTSGTNAPFPGTIESEFQGSVVANLCNGGTMYVDWVHHPVTATLSYTANNNVDDLYFYTHVFTGASIGFCLPIPLLPAPAPCSLVGKLTNPGCGSQCSCTSWELAKLSVNLLVPTAVDLQFKICNYCPQPIDFLTTCLGNLAVLNAGANGSVSTIISPAGRSISVTTIINAAASGIVNLCLGTLLKFNINDENFNNGACDYITLSLLAWTPTFNFDMSVHLLNLGESIEEQSFNLLSCPPVACNTPTTTISIPLSSSVQNAFGPLVSTSATLRIVLPGFHDQAKVIIVDAAVTATVRCGGYVIPIIIVINPATLSFGINDNNPQGTQGLLSLPILCALGVPQSVTATASLGATISLDPINITAQVMVQITVGGVSTPFVTLPSTPAIPDLGCPLCTLGLLCPTVTFPPLAPITPATVGTAVSTTNSATVGGPTPSPTPSPTFAPTPAPTLSPTSSISPPSSQSPTATPSASSPSVSPAPSSPSSSPSPSLASSAPPTTQVSTPSPTTATPTPPPPPAINCFVPGAAPPLCDCGNTSNCLLAPANFRFYCVPDGSGSYTWDAISIYAGITVGADWVQPGNGTDPNGFAVDCCCNVVQMSCPPCNGSTCICDKHQGVCVASSICNTTPSPSFAGVTCASCPTDEYNIECSGNGVCNCGTCVCDPDANITYVGPICAQPPPPPNPCGNETDCTSCLASTFNCSWCNSGSIAVCQSAETCGPFSVTVCAGGSSVASVCPNNCSLHGQCQSDNSTGIIACHCNDGYHGSDCSASGGLSSGTKAAIAGGVIAAIVIAGAITLGALAFGAKKGVDYMLLTKENMSSAQTNPSFVPQVNEADNPTFGLTTPRT